jgi:ComF family protein
LAQAVRENGPLIGGPFSVVPVPPRPGKLRKQGWDQVDLLAEHMSALESLPVNRCLRRLPSKTQKELGREDRIRNLRGRIVCASTPPQRAVIIDDVITTGATLSACSGALMEAGCVRVFALALCYD